MESKTFGVGAAGLVIGLAISQILPRGGRSGVETPTPRAEASATPFACARTGGTPAEEIASHNGRVTVFVNWDHVWGVPWLPTIERLRASYAPRGVDFVGVPTVNADSDVGALCREHRLRWQQLQVPMDDAWRRHFGNRYVVVVDRRGQVSFRGYFEQGIALAIDDALQEEPRAVNGRVLHRGRTIANFTDGEPKISVRSALNWNASDVPVEYFRATGSFTAMLVPGTYFMSVDVGGDWTGGTHLGVPDYPSDKPLEIELQRRVHLTSPIDSNIPQGRYEDPPPFHASPVTFSWDAVPGATKYFWSASGDGGRSGTTTDTRATADLPPGEYTIHVTAYEDWRTIGSLRVPYSNSPMNAYRFRVPPK